MPAWAAALVLTAICAAGIWFDVSQRRLPNWLCLLALLAGLAASLVLGQPWAIASHALHALLALLVGIGLFQLGLIGGGDAKFYAGIAAWFALGQAAQLLIAVSLAGLAALLLWIAWRRITGKGAHSRSEADFDKFPYGTAIGLGAIAAAFSRLV